MQIVNFWLRGRAEINSHSGASAGWADARRRDAGAAGHRRGAATPQMPVRCRAPQGGRFSDMQYAMPTDTQSTGLRTGSRM
jgi:hypothetical protein